jgi:hypothetical protein
MSIRANNIPKGALVRLDSGDVVTWLGRFYILSFKRSPELTGYTHYTGDYQWSKTRHSFIESTDDYRIRYQRTYKVVEIIDGGSWPDMNGAGHINGVLKINETSESCGVYGSGYGTVLVSSTPFEFEVELDLMSVDELSATWIRTSPQTLMRKSYSGNLNSQPMVKLCALYAYRAATQKFYIIDRIEDLMSFDRRDLPTVTQENDSWNSVVKGGSHTRMPYYLGNGEREDFSFNDIDKVFDFFIPRIRGMYAPSF